jgi:hypothetical protein
MISEEEFLLIAKKHYSQISSAASEQEDFYEYEKGIVTVMDKMTRDVLEEGAGKLPSDKRKKKLYSPRED